jgi:sugar transferase (PEP-CTERM/EpsH1 system associated)
MSEGIMSSTRPHLVHVVHSLQTGGTEIGLVNMVGALAREFQHTVIGMVEGGPLEARLPVDVAVHRLGKRSGLDLGAIGRLASILRALRPDIVHSRNWGAFDAVIAGAIARVPSIVHGEHGREANDPAGLDRRRNRLRRWTAPLVTRYVAVSEDLGRWLTERIGIPPRKVVTIHNGVDIMRFQQGDRIAARRAVGLDVPSGAVVVGTVGRLDPVKDQLGLLEAFAAVAASRPEVALVIAGRGPLWDAIESRSRHPDLAGRVSLLGERSDTPTILQALDIFALPSLTEGISNTVLEAMASGLPVVATRTGGTPELVVDGLTGTLVPVGDRSALARALTAYVANSRARAQHGAAGRQRAVESFSLERMTARYRSLYRELTGLDRLGTWGRRPRVASGTGT